MYREAGDNMEYLAVACGLNVNVEPGTSTVVHDNGTSKIRESSQKPTSES
jgi:hypothetical protein